MQDVIWIKILNILARYYIDFLVPLGIKHTKLLELVVLFGSEIGEILIYQLHE